MSFNKKITIIDYGMGNISSIQNSFDYLKYSCNVSSDKNEIMESDALILPGVGSFNAAMKNIVNRNLDEIIKDYVQLKKKPILGICLGMQLLADKGEEDGETMGLGLINGEVKKIETNNLRLPHIGFNSVNQSRESSLFNDIPPNSDFYFVHSYHFVCKHNEDVLATTEYGENIVSTVSKKNVFGVQFHPEKSQSNGLKFLSNFLKMIEN